MRAKRIRAKHHLVPELCSYILGYGGEAESVS